MAHTPEPWRIWEPQFSDGLYETVESIIISRSHRNDCDQEIAYVNCDSVFFRTKKTVQVKSSLVRTKPRVNKEAMDNARLIRAAPKLLKALKGLLSKWDSSGFEEDFFEVRQARKAIKLAE